MRRCIKHHNLCKSIGRNSRHVKKKENIPYTNYDVLRLYKWYIMNKIIYSHVEQSRPDSHDFDKKIKYALADIKKHIAIDKVKLTKSQHIYIAYHDDLIKRINYDEITKHYELIRSVAPTVVVTGSYRRGEKTSSDIDIIVRQPINEVVSALTNIGYIRDKINHGAKKFSGIVKLPGPDSIHRHIDIIFTTPRAYPFALLYFTGSKRFNIIMRLNAKKKGFKLNEYGLWDGMNLVPNIKTERDIFKAIGKPYVMPEDR